MSFLPWMLKAEPSCLEEHQALVNDEDLSSSKKMTSGLANSYLIMEEIHVLKTFEKCLSTFQ